MTTFSSLVTFAVFAVAGSACARFVKTATPRTFVLLLLAAVIGGWVGINTELLSVAGFALRLNVAVPAFCVGLLVGLLVRRRLAAPAA